MAFHVSSFGWHAGLVSEFVDRNGFVPFGEDAAQEFSYAHLIEDWDAFKAKAEQAINAANDAVMADEKGSGWDE